jgi:hypothetical protein
MRPFTLLGVKVDDCANCGNVGQHLVGRRTTWGAIFWIPFLFLGFRHGMICGTCGTWTKLRWADVRQARRTGRLHLERSRPHAETVLVAAGAESGAPPLSPAVFDEFAPNPKPGGWDLYVRAYPVAIVGIVLAAVLLAATKGPTPPPAPNTTWTAHDCWEARDGSLNGCRMKDGSMVGEAEGSPIVCYFAEPMPVSESVSCQEH